VFITSFIVFLAVIDLIELPSINVSFLSPKHNLIDYGLINDITPTQEKFNLSDDIFSTNMFEKHNDCLQKK